MTVCKKEVEVTAKRDKTVYVAEDGTEFDNRNDCCAYEKSTHTYEEDYKSLVCDFFEELFGAEYDTAYQILKVSKVEDFDTIFNCCDIVFERDTEDLKNDIEWYKEKFDHSPMYLVMCFSGSYWCGVTDLYSFLNEINDVREKLCKAIGLTDTEENAE